MGNFALYYEVYLMGTKDNQEGFDDGKNGDHYEPPHRQGIVETFVDPNDSDKIQSNNDYTEGWKDGRDYREKNRK